MRLYCIIRIPNRIIRTENDISLCYMDTGHKLNTKLTSNRKLAESTATSLNNQHGKMCIYRACRLTELKP